MGCSASINIKEARLKTRLANETIRPSQNQGQVFDLISIQVCHSARTEVPFCLAVVLDLPHAAVEADQRGVTLAFLLHLVESGAVDGTHTVQQVVDEFVRPQTATTRCCLFDMVPRVSTGKPEFFISHTWSQPLRNLLTLLKKHFKAAVSTDRSAQVVVWLDIVSINQHAYGDRACLLDDDVANLAKVVLSTRRTLLCLDKKCVALTRIWCLYEVWQAFLSGGAAKLLLLMPDVDGQALETVFDTFDVSQAQATQPADRSRILEEIRLGIGHTAMNLQLKRALVDSARYEAEHTLAVGEELAKALHNAACMLSSNGEYVEALAMERRAHQTCDDTLGSAHPATLSSLLNVIHVRGKSATYFTDAHYSDTLAMCHQAVAGFTALYGSVHVKTLHATEVLALCLSTLERHAEALPLFQQAYDGRVHLLGATDSATMEASANLALCFRALGQHGQALSMLHNLAGSFLQANGSLHPLTLLAYNNWAACLEEAGQSEEALPVFKQTLARRESVLGQLHPDTLTSLNYVAKCLQSLDRLDEALSVYRQQLQRCQDAFGPEHHACANSMVDLATCLGCLEQHGEALPLFQQAAAVYAGQIGDADFNQGAVRQVLSVLKQQAGCLISLERIDEAVLVYGQVIAKATAEFGITDIETLATCTEVACELLDIQRYDDALPVCRLDLARHESALGLTHADTLVSLWSLAVCLHSLCGEKEALPLFTRLLLAREEAVGANHLDTLACVTAMADCLNDMASFEAALPMYQRALAGNVLALGESDVETLAVAMQLGGCLSSLDRDEEALLMLERVLKGREQVLGALDTDTLASVVAVARSLENLGRCDEAVVMYVRGLDGYEQVLGKDHPDTVGCADDLSECRLAMQASTENRDEC